MQQQKRASQNMKKSQSTLPSNRHVLQRPHFVRWDEVLGKLRGPRNALA